MEDKIKDKQKIQEILIELSNLKKYSNELSSNTRGDKLERYINNFSKYINILDEHVEKIYEDNYTTNE